MKNTILFDLDGTLLPMDFDQFTQKYFTFMGHHFKEDIDPNILPKLIWDATKMMVTTNDGRTNEDIFMECFKSYVPKNIEFYKSKFNEYYDTLFEEVKSTTYESKEIQDGVKLLKDKGYNLVIATNPLFPLKANYHRIRWAGLDKNDFMHITSFEQNKHCKPFPQFYQEVLNTIDKQPEECMMVGNDVEEDLIASAVGIETYLITDCIVNKKNLENTANHTGTYKDFYTFCEKLPSIK